MEEAPTPKPLEMEMQHKWEQYVEPQALIIAGTAPSSAAQISCAISLKRIADTWEAMHYAQGEVIAELASLTKASNELVLMANQTNVELKEVRRAIGALGPI